MTLSWQPPTDDGGAPVTHYIIEKRDTSAIGGWQRVDRIGSHLYRYLLTDLLEGHKYHFRVIAENSHGPGLPLESKLPSEARSQYGNYLNLFKNKQTETFYMHSILHYRLYNLKKIN